MHTDQIDVDPKNRPIEARLAFAYVQIMKSRLVNWFSIGIGTLYQSETLYICKIICLTLQRIMFIDCLNSNTRSLKMDLILAFINNEMALIEEDGFYSGAELERWHRLKRLADKFTV